MIKHVFNLIKVKKIYNIIDNFEIDRNMFENMEIKDVIDYLLIHSIILDDIETFIKLHKMGADTNRSFMNEYNRYNLHAINENYIKPIHYVLIANKPNGVFFLDYLIDDCNVSPNELDGNGRTPINFATLKGNIKFIEYLLECDDIDLTINKSINRPVVNILNNNSIDDVRKTIIIKKLMEHNIDIDSQDNYGVTPFMVTAAICKDISLFNYMVSLNCNPYKIDKFGNNILHYACKNSNQVNVKVVQYILQNFKKINIDQMNNNMETPLSVAFSTLGGDSEIIDIFEQNGADFKNIFKTALENNPQMITLKDLQKFVDKEADLNIRDRHNNSIIMKMVNRDINRNMSDKEIYEIVDFLISKKVDISTKNREGNDLHYYLSKLNKNNNIFSELIKKIDETY